MPIVITYEISDRPSVDRNQIQSFFERFGWENLGGSSYRYPKLGTTSQPVEDWLNHVIPALMLFRSYVIKYPGSLSKYTLDIQASTGFSPKSGFGSQPVAGNNIQLYPPTNAQFGESNLRNWLNNVAYPY